MFETFQARLRTLTAVHTGGVDRRSRELKVSGLIGSLRWWMESLVRGLGVFACDPTSMNGCHFNLSAYGPEGNLQEGLRDVCPVCRLFGCTGWRRKFRLRVKNHNGPLSLSQAGISFSLEFIELKPVLEEERWLLNRTLYLISEYGSIGGRTTLKPPEMPDYGLVKLIENIPTQVTRKEVADKLRGIMENSSVLSHKYNGMPKEYPRLENFFFNKGHWLDRRQMNEVMAVDETGFMQGRIGVSKKLFSFQTDKRFWGYTTGEPMLQKVLAKLQEMGIPGTKTGREILNEL